MQDFLTWGAIIIAGGSIVAVIKFWMGMGAHQARAENAAELARLSSAKYDLLLSQLNDFKVEAARTYATVRALSETETQLAGAFERGMQGIFTRLDGLTQRIDSLITVTKQHH